MQTEREFRYRVSPDFVLPEGARTEYIRQAIIARSDSISGLIQQFTARAQLALARGLIMNGFALPTGMGGLLGGFLEGVIEHNRIKMTPDAKCILRVREVRDQTGTILQSVLTTKVDINSAGADGGERHKYEQDFSVSPLMAQYILEHIGESPSDRLHPEIAFLEKVRTHLSPDGLLVHDRYMNGPLAGFEIVEDEGMVHPLPVGLELYHGKVTDLMKSHITQKLAVGTK